MNKLAVGLDKRFLLDNLPERFLVIDDGEFIEAIGDNFPQNFEVVKFDTDIHSFNVLKDMDYRRAREFWTVLKAVFPEGENTLTKAAAEFQILEALTDNPTSLETLVSKTKDTQYAYQMIGKLLLSPVLERVLTRPTNMSFKGIILARLDRAKLTDFDCYVIASFLTSLYPYTVIIPDFGFYQNGIHTRLLRQNRLWAGINAFAEVPNFKQSLLLIEERVGRHTTLEDAELLASYALIPKVPEGRYRNYIEKLTRA